MCRHIYRTTVSGSAASIEARCCLTGDHCHHADAMSAVVAGEAWPKLQCWRPPTMAERSRGIETRRKKWLFVPPGVSLIRDGEHQWYTGFSFGKQIDNN